MKLRVQRALARPLVVFSALVGLAPGITAADRPVLAVESAPNEVRLSWRDAAGTFQLEQTGGLDTATPWAPVLQSVVVNEDLRQVSVTPAGLARFYRLGVSALPATVLETSPAEGESGVAVTRETVVRLSAPLSPTAQLTANTLFAGFGGRRILSRADLSADRQTLTLFYLENLPASARITVVLDPTGLVGANQLEVDADGDGLPGGVKTMSFSTLGIVGLPGTGVEGRVFASEKGPGGTNRPLTGVTVTVDGDEETLRTVTGADGFFRLMPAPVGRFFVHVDGRTAVGSEWPDGAYYPFVGKAWTTVVGRSNNLAGEDGLIYLPHVEADALTALNAAASTRVTFSAGAVATNPLLAGVEVMVPANSLVNANGARGGRVGMAPVAPDRLPEKLPAGLDFPLVITIQTDGAQNFDQPVPVKFPNLPDPRTGVKLPPGAKTALWSFNHDTGRWEMQGSMTISADGLFAVSDVGVGVRQPGWHGVNPGTGGAGPNPPPPPPPPFPPRPGPCEGAFDCDGDGCMESLVECDKEDCDKYLKEMQRLEEYCSYGDLMRDQRDGMLCGLPLIDCPDPAWLQKWKQCREAIDNAKFNYAKCLSRQASLSASQRGIAAPAALAADDPRWVDTQKLIDAAVVPVQLLLGDPRWTQMEPSELDIWQALFAALAVAAEPNSPGGPQITAAERTTLLGVARPSNLSVTLVNTAIDRLNAYRANTLPAAQRTEIDAATKAYSALWAQQQAKGWRSTVDGLLAITSEQSEINAAKSARTFSRTRRLFYRLTDLSSGFEFRGRLNGAGYFDNIFLAPDTYYEVDYFDPLVGAVGTATFRSAGAGKGTTIPAAPMTIPVDLIDSDSDGLADVIEPIVGTRADLADTDGDGRLDAAELASGSNPTDGQPMGMGVVAALNVGGAAQDVAVSGELALVGTRNGMAIVNLQNSLEPVVVGQFAGSSVETVAAGDGIGVGAHGNRQISLLDLSSTANPRVVRVLGLDTFARAVGVGEGSVFVGQRNGVVLRLDPEGVELARLFVPNPEEVEIQDLVVRDGLLFVLQPGRLTACSLAGGTLTLQTSLESPGAVGAGGRRLRFGEGFQELIATHTQGYNVFDLSNPALPVLKLNRVTTQLGWKQMAPDGAGLGLAAVGANSTDGGAHDVSIYRIGENSTGTNFLATLTMPKIAAAVRPYRGLALVAASEAGLLTVNYRTATPTTNPPPLTVRVRTSLPPDRQEAGRRFWASAVTAGEVQVQFLVDEELQSNDSSFPFVASLLAPRFVPGKTTFTVRVRGIDAFGRIRLSAPVTLKLDPDSTQPRLLSTTPAEDSPWLPGELSFVSATFNEAMKPAGLVGALRVTEVGADGIPGTADDIPVPATLSYPVGTNETARLNFTSPLRVGEYAAQINASAAVDLFNNALASNRVWRFSVRDQLVFARAGEGSWLVSNNWAPTRIPTSRDIVSIPPGHPANTGPFNVAELFANRLEVRSPLTIGSTNPETQNYSHILDVAGVADLAAPVQIWSQSGLVGSGTFYNTSSVEYRGAAGGSLGGTFINDGVLRLIGPGRRVLGLTGLRLANRVGGLLEFVDETTFIHSQVYPSIVVENAGVIRKRGPGDSLLQAGQFIHTGRVEVEGGGLEIVADEGSNLAGYMSVAAGARLTLSVGLAETLDVSPINLGPSALITGAGTARISATPTVRGTVDMEGSMETTGGRFLGSVRVASRYESLSGSTSFEGLLTSLGGQVRLRGTTTFMSPSTARLGDVSLANNARLIAAGPVLIQGGLSVSNQARLEGSSRISVLGPSFFSGQVDGGTTLELNDQVTFLPGAKINHAAGRWLIESGSELRLDGLASFAASELRVSGLTVQKATQSLALTTGLYGTGRVDVLGGTLSLASRGGSFRGQLNSANNAVLALSGSGQFFEPESRIVCAGLLDVVDQLAGQAGASNTFRGSVTTPRLHLGRRRLNFDADYTFPEVTIDHAGEFGGSGTVTIERLILGDSVNFVGSGTTRMLGTTVWSNTVALQDTRRLENLGTVRVLGAGRLSITRTPQFFNRTGAILDFQNDRDFINNIAVSLINEGTLIKSGGTGATTVAGSIKNSGTIEIRTGEIQVGQNALLDQTAGLCWLNGGTLSSVVRISGGVFRGANSALKPLSSFELLGSSELDIQIPGGGAGELYITGGTGRYTQAATATLQMDIGGSKPGVDSDHLNAVNLTLAGQVNIRIAAGFIPGLGQEFEIIKFTGTRTGQFTSVTSLGMPAGRKLEVIYVAGSVRVRVVAG